MALHFLEIQTNADDDFQNLIKLLRDLKISDNKHEFKLFLRSILKISNNYNRKSNCISKINLILKSLEKEIKLYYSNSEIFDIFKSNKLILLFLFKEKILIIDQYIIKTFIIKEKYEKANYPQYFSPEIRLFKKEPWFPEKKPCVSPSWRYEIEEELPQDFEEKREKGENDSYVCQLIRDVQMLHKETIFMLMILYTILHFSYFSNIEKPLRYQIYFVYDFFQLLLYQQL